MNEHIKTLDDLLKQKGYDGYFLVNEGHPDRLAKSLERYFAAAESGKEYGPVIPIHLMTYITWNGSESDFITCRFTVDYGNAEGFSISQMSINLKDTYWQVKSKKELPIQLKESIPSRKAAVALVKPQEITEDLPLKKGMKH